jgi:hypothetical protein
MNRRNLRSTGIRRLPSGRYQITFRDGNGVKHRESFDREKDPGQHRMNGALPSETENM